MFLSGAPPSVGAERTKKILAKTNPQITGNGPFQALQRDTKTLLSEVFPKNRPIVKSLEKGKVF